MSSFKDSEIKIYEENISKYSLKAVEVIFNWFRTYSKLKKYSQPFAKLRVTQTSKKNVHLYTYSFQKHVKIACIGDKGDK